LLFSWQRTAHSTLSTQGEPALTFAQVLAGAKQGEQEELATLYRHFLPVVFGYIATRVPDRHTAEDLTSDVFVQMVAGIRKIRASDETSFAAWLIQVARMTVAGYYRKQEKRPILVALDAENGETEAALLDQPEADPVRRAEGREELHAVVQAINTLTEDQRQVLVGRVILGYDLATVARMVGKQTNTVKVLQFRALRNLKQRLQKNHTQPELLTLRQEAP